MTESINVTVLSGQCIINLQPDLENLMTELTELASDLSAIGATLDKAKTEIIDKIDGLVAALAGQQLPDEAVAALDALKASAQALDDIVPDAQPQP